MALFVAVDRRCRAALAAPQTARRPTEPQAAARSPTAKPADQKPDDRSPTDTQKYEETVVVSASKTEEKLINAPATMTVIGADDDSERADARISPSSCARFPASTSPRCRRATSTSRSRSATGTLATGQLALLDGRSLYQDFFGFVMWDFLPVNLNEIKQIEVIRGPASAVWGANALNGVVNVITKSPREMQGTSVTLGVGGFDRRPAARPAKAQGTLFYISGTHAQAINDRLVVQDVRGRLYPGVLRASDRAPFPATGRGLRDGARRPIPRIANQGTSQPKFDARVDYDYPDGAQAVVLRRRRRHRRHHAHRHRALRHQQRLGDGLRPVSTYTDKGLHVAAFTNILNGDAANLLTTDTTGAPIGFIFQHQDLRRRGVGRAQTFRHTHVVTYGGNLRYNTFNLSLAPQATNRTEGGGYLQDEIFLSNTFPAGRRRPGRSLRLSR